MMSKKIFNFLAIGFLSIGFIACGSKDSEPEDPNKPSGEMEKLTPTEAKKFLENTANEFLGKFRAADQSDLIKLASYFEYKYGDLEMPKEFEIDGDETVSPSRLMVGLSKSFVSGNPSRAVSEVISYVYTIDFKTFRGVYKPSGYRWVRAGESEDIIFQFTDMNGANCELRATASKDNSTGKITWTEDYYDYWEDEEYRENYVLDISIPKQVNISLKQSGKELASAKVESDISLKNHTVNAICNVKAANINIEGKLEGTDSKATQSSSLSVGGETLITTSATLNGHKLCDYEHYKGMVEDDIEDILVSLLDNGNATMTILGKISIDAKGKYSNSLFNALDGSYSSWNYETQSEAEKAIKNAIGTLEKNITAQVRFNNKNTVQARLSWDYAQYDWYYDVWEYEIVPVLYFESDGTSYEFEKYFERGFSSVEDTWSDLQMSYEKVWDSIRK